MRRCPLKRGVSNDKRQDFTDCGRGGRQTSVSDDADKLG
jgi:hypothetical protein